MHEKSIKLEYTAKEDEFFDYCLYKYLPYAKTLEKFRSVNLLTSFFEFMNYDSNFYNIIAEIRKNIGFNKTVWGIKKVGDTYNCELYFYNWHKKDPDITVKNLLKSVKPFLDCSIAIDENLYYHMFSFDLLPIYVQSKKLPQIHIYFGYSGYLFDEKGIKLENNYSFHYVKTEMNKLLSMVKRSAFVDFSKIDLNEVIIPELASCQKICRAYKPQNDGIYFSRLNIDQFIFFLNKFSYPAPLISFVMQNRSKLDHLLYDIGFDYKSENGKLIITKSGYYGTF